jgi:hypothetical protein
MDKDLTTRQKMKFTTSIQHLFNKMAEDDVMGPLIDEVPGRIAALLLGHVRTTFGEKAFQEALMDNKIYKISTVPSNSGGNTQSSTDPSVQGQNRPKPEEQKSYEDPKTGKFLFPPNDLKLSDNTWNRGLGKLRKVISDLSGLKASLIQIPKIGTFESKLDLVFATCIFNNPGGYDSQRMVVAKEFLVRILLETPIGLSVLGHWINDPKKLENSSSQGSRQNRSQMNDENSTTENPIPSSPQQPKLTVQEKKSKDTYRKRVSGIKSFMVALQKDLKSYNQDTEGTEEGNTNFTVIEFANYSNQVSRISWQWIRRKDYHSLDWAFTGKKSVPLIQDRTSLIACWTVNKGRLPKEGNDAPNGFPLQNDEGQAYMDMNEETLPKWLGAPATKSMWGDLAKANPTLEWLKRQSESLN